MCEALSSAYVQPDEDGEGSRSLEVGVIKENNDPLEDIAAGLNEEQKRAFFLVCDHRRRNNLNGMDKPSQLLLYLSGAGGTGKSRVIQAICEYFDRIGKRKTLLVLAFTGIAASNRKYPPFCVWIRFRGGRQEEKQSDRIYAGAAPRTLVQYRVCHLRRNIRDWPKTTLPLSCQCQDGQSS